jgi:hypothetical protein
VSTVSDTCQNHGSPTSRQLFVTDVPSTTPRTTSAWTTAPTRLWSSVPKPGNCQFAPRVSQSPHGRTPKASSQVRVRASSPMSFSARPRERNRAGRLERPRSQVLGPGAEPRFGV